MRELEFGWFLPTRGDTLDYAVPQQIPPSPEMFERVVQTAEDNGFEYILLPVAAACWDAWLTSALLTRSTKKIKMLVAARPSYINPVLLAKMIATFDQMTQGRISINLIAGQNDVENEAEGVGFDKVQRYEVMEEEVEICKALWSDQDKLDHDGRYYKLKQAHIGPAIFQKPYPKFYLGGGSSEAEEFSAKHANVHLFWGDTVERIKENMERIRKLASKYDRGSEIGFGMRLQIICRKCEQDAWDVAEGLIKNVTDDQKKVIKEHFASSVANQRVQQLSAEYGEMLAPNLWTGLTAARPGAGIVIVGTPEQCADTLQKYIDIGCHSFCLSGYLHDEEAARFGNWVRPILCANNPGRIKNL
ncbi:MAG: alkanesulfonate monooxygenase [Rhodospirillaceae bacterium]|nr:alkanesulfonate monooxygenase [Rhodospirillaceae bacterium]